MYVCMYALDQKVHGAVSVIWREVLCDRYTLPRRNLISRCSYPIMSNGMYVRKTVAREQERSKIKKKVKRGRMHKAKKSFNYPSNFAETAPRPWRELTAFVQKFILLFLPLGFCVLAVLMGISGSWLIL